MYMYIDEEQFLGIIIYCLIRIYLVQLCYNYVIPKIIRNVRINFGDAFVLITLVKLIL